MFAMFRIASQRERHRDARFFPRMECAFGIGKRLLNRFFVACILNGRAAVLIGLFQHRIERRRVLLFVKRFKRLAQRLERLVAAGGQQRLERCFFLCKCLRVGHAGAFFFRKLRQQRFNGLNLQRRFVFAVVDGQRIDQRNDRLHFCGRQEILRIAHVVEAVFTVEHSAICHQCVRRLLGRHSAFLGRLRRVAESAGRLRVIEQAVQQAGEPAVGLRVDVPCAQGR